MAQNKWETRWEGVGRVGMKKVGALFLPVSQFRDVEEWGLWR